LNILNNLVSNLRMFYLIMYWELTGTEHPENIMVVGGHLDLGI
jgi:hypothetical protein